MSQTKENENNLIVKVFDVGHGDSILVEFPDGKHLGIVDCNSHVPSNRQAECNGQDKSNPKVLSYLIKKLINKEDENKEVKLDYIIGFICLSHYHLDHYHGMGCLVRELQKHDNIKIEEFWDPGISKKKFEALKKMIEEKESPETIEKADQLKDLFDVLDPLLEAKKTGV